MTSHMTNENKKWLTITLIIISCTLVGIISGLWALNYESRIPWDRPRPFPPNIPSFVGDFEFYYTAKTVFSSVNIILVVSLIVTYISLYRKNRSNFVLGLILFAIVLLFYALSSNPLIMYLFGFRAFGLGPFAVLPDLFTTISLAILLYLTFK